MVLLRKLLNTRSPDSRILAIHGMSILLTNRVPKEEDQDNIITALRPAFGFSLDVREHLYRNVALLLYQIKNQNNTDQVRSKIFVR